MLSSEFPTKVLTPLLKNYGLLVTLLPKAIVLSS